MIRLFESTATSFDTLGLGNLTDATKALVVEERNGEFEIELDYPIDGVHYKDIALRCIIYCRPNPYTDEQPFRIYYISKPISGIVTIKAAHLSYDLSGIVVNPFSANSPGEALTGIKKNASTPCPFNFTTTKTGDAGFNVEVPKSARSILAGSEGSVLDIYGKGEYEFNGYDVKLHLNRGANNGVTLRYGKNIIDLNQEENCSNMYTGVYPYWKGSVAEVIHEKETDDDGNVHEVEDTKYVDTLVVLPELIVNAEGTFNFTNIYPLDLSSEFQSENQSAPTQEQIRNRAKQYIADNNIGVPKINLTVSFVALEQAEEYEQLRLLEKVNLCDTVTIIFEKLGVNATAKCIKTTYNAITHKYESLEFGDSSTKFVDNIIDQSEAVQDIPTKGFMELAIDRATKLITGGLGGYVLLHSSTGSSTPDEILILEPESKGDYKQANRIWRWNYQGLGYSNNGYNGPYGLAMTIDGEINADFINTGQLNVGGTGADTINIYDAKGINKLVWFDNSGMHLAAGQQIEWANVKHPSNLATTTDVNGAAGDAYKSVTTYYYASRVNAGSTNHGQPQNKPDPSKAKTTKVWGDWSTVCQDVDATADSTNSQKYKYDCYFWMCPVYTTRNNSYSYGPITEFDNSLATTIITKNSITTSFINALSITAASVACENLTGNVISGKKILSQKFKSDGTVEKETVIDGGNITTNDLTVKCDIDMMTLHSTYCGNFYCCKQTTDYTIDFYDDVRVGENVPNGRPSQKQGGGDALFYSVHSLFVQSISDDIAIEGWREKSSKCVKFQDRSDRRLKDNIKTLSKDIVRKFFKLINPVSFNFKSEMEKDAFGVIAQEVQEVIPELGFNDGKFIFKSDRTEYLGVDYTQFHAWELRGIQDLYDICAKQQAEIDDLKSQIKELREEK